MMMVHTLAIDTPHEVVRAYCLEDAYDSVLGHVSLPSSTNPFVQVHANAQLRVDPETTGNFVGCCRKRGGKVYRISCCIDLLEVSRPL